MEISPLILVGCCFYFFFFIVNEVKCLSLSALIQRPGAKTGSSSVRLTMGDLIEHEHAKKHPVIFFDRANVSNPGAYLYSKLLRNYNQDVLPVNRSSSAVAIQLLMKLAQIVDVDEKNQIMTTNVWLRHQWYDTSLQWDPRQHGGIETLHIPADEVWLPDTVLYNNADGDYQITMSTIIEVRHDGLVTWEPPAIYKSFCAIDVEFFPYDTQLCHMKIRFLVGPWTYDVSKVDYFLLSPDGHTGDYEEKIAVDLSGFYGSVEWDVLSVSGSRTVFRYPCCEEAFVDITYKFNIRRKTLFYTINLILPCIIIAFLTVLIFYLPARSGEKVAFSISTLLALTWFTFLLSEIIPPTSLALPLLGRYLLFTMALVTLSLSVTILVLYNAFRHPYIAKMPFWLRYLFLDVLPKIFFFRFVMGEKQEGLSASPTMDDEMMDMDDDDDNDDGVSIPENRMYAVEERFSSSPSTSPESSPRWPLAASVYFIPSPRHRLELLLLEEILPIFAQYMNLVEVRDAVRCIQYISRRYQAQSREIRMRDDWRAVSRVLDRLLLLIFIAAALLGSLAILLTAQSLFDTTPPLSAIDMSEIVAFNFHSNASSY